jgi:hypothetical protein
MAGVQGFLEGWERLLEELDRQAEIGSSFDDADEIGFMGASLLLSSRFRVEVSLRMEFRKTPVLERYSVQLLDGDGHLLRYDNAGHHAGLPGFPHHRHFAGGEVAPVIPPPSLRAMLAAVQDEVEGRPKR